MKNKLIFLILGMFLISFISASTFYTPTTDTVCVNGVCNKVLYSGVRNVFEDLQWKRVEDAHSLKGTKIVPKIIEDDENFPIEIVDYNYSSITVKLNPKGIKVFNQDIPVRVWKQNNTKAEDFEKDLKEGKKISKGVKDYKSKMEKVKEENIKYNLLNQEEVKTYKFGMGDILEFGFNSTTIILQDADTENMADLYHYGAGAGTAQYSTSAYIKYNISSLPDSVTINNVTLYLYVTSISGWGESLTYFRLNNQTWTESDSCSDIQSIEKVNQTTSSWGTSTGWQPLTENITEMVNEDYSLNNDYFSIRLSTGITTSYCSNTSGTLSLGYKGENPDSSIDFTSKEYSNVSLRPYLNITYTEGGGANDTTAPVVSLGVPTDNAYINYTNVKFNCSATEDTNLDNISYWFTGILTETETDVGLLSGSWTNNFTFDYENNGDYNWTCSATDNSSNTGWATNRTIHVNIPSPSNCDVLFNETSPITYPANFTVYTNCDSAFTMYRNGTEISNNSNQNLDLGSYNFTVIRNDTMNFTNIFDDEIFIVQNVTAPSSTTSTNVCDNFFTGYSGFASIFPIIFSVLALIILVGGFALVYDVWNKNGGKGEGLNFMLVISFVLGIVGIVIVSIIMFVIKQALCQII